MFRPVIETTELATLANPRLLDVRDPDAFAAAHAAGALRVPVERWIEAAREDELSFADLAFWRQEIRAFGLREGETAVVYDAGQMTEAARVWFVLQYFGTRAVVLNGGWPALKTASQAIGAPRPSSSGPLQPRPGAGPVGLLRRSELKEELDSAAILDARTPAEYSGEDLRGNPRGGHLPGARLLPHADLLENGLLKPADALRSLIAGTGFQPGDHIVTHCDGGGRAALAALAAVYAGFHDVNVYYLSFSDWAKDETCPVVAG